MGKKATFYTIAGSDLRQYINLFWVKFGNNYANLSAQALKTTTLLFSNDLFKGKLGTPSTAYQLKNRPCTHTTGYFESIK